jgi:transposase-like protein
VNNSHIFLLEQQEGKDEGNEGRNSSSGYRFSSFSQFDRLLQLNIQRQRQEHLSG